MRVFVTGVGGQLGHDVMDELARRGIEAVGSDIHETLDTPYAYRQLDITNPDAVRRVLTDVSPDAVIHCAAWTAVDAAEDEANREKVHLINAVGTENIARVCKDLDSVMMYISTDYVFDGTSCRPYREDDHTHPQTVYGRTKLMGEESVVRLCPGAMVIRTGWLYSTFGHNFVKTMLRLGRERKELGVVADQVGTPTYARDLADAIMHVVDAGVLPGIYHYANEGATSWFDFAHAIHRAAGIDEDDCRLRPLHTEEYPVPAQRPHYSVLDKTKIKQTYGLSIPWWEDSLRECVKKL